MALNDNNWGKMKEGDKKAFLNIYQENYKILFSYGLSLCYDKELIKDCIQSIFLEIWNTRTTINPNVKNVRSYLCTWIRRKIQLFLIRKRKENAIGGYFYSLEHNEKSYDELLIAYQDSKEKKDKLTRALNNLTKKQLEIIRLKYFENLSYEEISNKTSLSNRTVYNTVYEAILRLREFMTIFF